MRTLPLLILLTSHLAWSQSQSCYLKLIEGQSYSVSDYEVQKKSCVISSDQRGVEHLRSFRSQGRSFAWVIDKKTLTSYVVQSACVVSCSKANDLSRYDKLLQGSTEAPFPLENDGLTKDLKTKNTYLTVDLCPSSKPYDQSFFQYLAKYHDAKGESFPVAIAISGGWMLNHKEELKEILDLQKAGKIQITWVNHTRHHPYSHGKSYEHNFLLSENVDPQTEILDQEQVMLAHGLLPSIFVRYPGLVSDKNLVELTRSLGLVPIGSQSWIRITNSFNAGDILLLHGNGNEVKGLIAFYELVKNGKILEYAWRALTEWGQY